MILSANVQGAEEIFKLLKPTLQEKDAELATEIENQFADVYRLLAEQKRRRL